MVKSWPCSVQIVSFNNKLMSQSRETPLTRVTLSFYLTENCQRKGTPKSDQHHFSSYCCLSENIGHVLPPPPPLPKPVMNSVIRLQVLLPIL